jgi:hypothetical protein
VTVLSRYLFGILAVCTAFAIGVALGGGPLQSRFADADAGSEPRPTSHSWAQRAAERDARLEAALTSATSRPLLRDRLTARSVAVVVLPGVPKSTVAGYVDAVHQAGGLTPVVARLSADLVNPAKKAYVDSVATSSLRNRPDVAATAGSDTYERIGAVVARAYVGPASNTTYDVEASGIDAELQGARLVRLDKTPVRRGSLVLVVAPRSGSRGQYAAASRVIHAQLITALAASSDGAVLVSLNSGGDSLTAGWPPGLRAAAPLSTLNVSGGPASRVAAVFALAAAANGQVGDFGVFGTSVRLPPGLGLLAN